MNRSGTSTSTSKASITTSRSYNNFGQSRRQQRGQSAAAAVVVDQRTSNAAVSKTYWPLPQLERAFLPHFPLADRRLRVRYRTEALLERGAFGVVYRVRDALGADASSSSRSEYALKVLSKAQVGVQRTKLTTTWLTS